jgi:CRISPR-associated endonuclease/helicase Cas3
MRKLLYARTKLSPDTGALLPEEEWQTLDEHLYKTALLTKKNAQAFGAESLGHAAGMLHDLGKASDDFQRRLKGSNDPVDHKSAGAIEAYRRYGKVLGKVLAYVIFGHHGGLPDDVSDDRSRGLSDVLKNKDNYIVGYNVETYPLESCMPRKPAANSIQQQAMYLSLLIRMLYSCLVDADYLDAEAFTQPEKYRQRVKSAKTLEELIPQFELKKKELLSHQSKRPIDILRKEVLKNCLKAGSSPKGIYSLTVPTGGGKTLSSLAFAFEHAKTHKDIRRIIYAIPFTSIIEQNANVFKQIFGQEAVLEHHSNYDISDDENDVNRLACENWDAPFIVTTNVQLFESLFSSKPSRSRKVHAMANSIIILDEAQMLPESVLLPSLSALQCLCANFGATVLFCSATQPAIKAEWIDDNKPYEIIPDPRDLYIKLKRININKIGMISNNDLAERLISYDQVLCIVNTRKHAKKLFNLISDHVGVYHLSALMCPAHRSVVLAEIKENLKKGKRCIVISTQLIEAGVDIDFPVVFRSSAGIDSIAQAAGRCNREGNQKIGEVYVFKPEEGLPSGWFSRMAQYGEEILSEYDDPLSPDAIEHFFRLRYGLGANLDENDIMKNLIQGSKDISFQFREIDEQFKLIKSPTFSVIIPYDDEASKIVEEAKNSLYPGSYLRKLQKYSVPIYEHDLRKLQEKGAVTNLFADYYLLTVNEIDFKNVYSDKLGLLVNYEMEVLIC